MAEKIASSRLIRNRSCFASATRYKCNALHCTTKEKKFRFISFAMGSNFQLRRLFYVMNIKMVLIRSFENHIFLIN